MHLAIDSPLTNLLNKSKLCIIFLSKPLTTCYQILDTRKVERRCIHGCSSCIDLYSIRTSL